MDFVRSIGLGYPKCSRMAAIRLLDVLEDVADDVDVDVDVAGLRGERGGGAVPADKVLRSHPGVWEAGDWGREIGQGQGDLRSSHHGRDARPFSREPSSLSLPLCPHSRRRVHPDRSTAAVNMLSHLLRITHTLDDVSLEFPTASHCYPQTFFEVRRTLSMPKTRPLTIIQRVPNFISILFILSMTNKR